MDKPFVRQGLEFAVITVNGQSFMMHQIRKMIGITIAIVQGLTGVNCIERAWKPDKCDIPRAPGLGLMLDKCHYDFYNKKFGATHDKLDWEDLKVRGGDGKCIVVTITKLSHIGIYNNLVQTNLTSFD